MERKTLHKFSLGLVIVVVLSLLGLNPHSALAGDTDDDEIPLIAPIRTSPEGQTYGRWAVEWWQRALGIPAAVNPLTDTTGKIVLNAKWIPCGFSPARPRLIRLSVTVRFQPESRCSSRLSTTFSGRF